MSAPDRPILLFDGVCNLCDQSVQFVLDHEPEGRIQFASLQSDVGQELLTEHELDGNDIDSVVLIEQGRAYTQSDAALRVASRLNGPWKWIALGRFVPRVLRDWAYRYVARNRYRWFGTRDACRLPTAETRSRFLDAEELA